MAKNTARILRIIFAKNDYLKLFREPGDVRYWPILSVRSAV